MVANKTYKIYRIEYGKKYSKYQTHFGRSLYVRVFHHYCGTRTEIPMIPLLILCLIILVRKSDDILATWFKIRTKQFRKFSSRLRGIKWQLEFSSRNHDTKGQSTSLHVMAGRREVFEKLWPPRSAVGIGGYYELTNFNDTVQISLIIQNTEWATVATYKETLCPIARG